MVEQGRDLPLTGLRKHATEPRANNGIKLVQQLELFEEWRFGSVLRLLSELRSATGGVWVINTASGQLHKIQVYWLGGGAVETKRIPPFLR